MSDLLVAILAFSPIILLITLVFSWKIWRRKKHLASLTPEEIVHEKVKEKKKGNEALALIAVAIGGALAKLGVGWNWILGIGLLMIVAGLLIKKFNK